MQSSHGRVVVCSVAAALVCATGIVPGAQAASQTLVIGVDHVDPANQRPDQARVFEYTDFFARDISVHTGDALDFRFAPGAFHVIALASAEPTARAAYPVALPDPDHVATGTGLPKVQLGPSNGPIADGSIFGGGQIGGPNDAPTCGLAAQPECAFAGGTDVEDAGGIAGVDPQTGNPTPVDWVIRINAPEGDYDYFCYIHPGMSGKLHVVPGDAPASSQEDVDKVSDAQFQTDQRLALEAENIFSSDTTTTDGNVVTHHVSVGVSAANNRVAIDEMLPRRISVNQGDQVEFKWRDPHNVHSVGIAQAETQLPPPFVFDCGASFMSPPSPEVKGGGFCFEPGDAVPETILDPGNALSGAFLRSTQNIIDSGVLLGTGYFVQPSTQTWSVRTDAKTQSGAYQFWCNVHDWMNGSLIIGG